VAVVCGVHNKQWVISVLGVVYEIKKNLMWRFRLSVRRETFFRFMKFPIGVQSCRAVLLGDSHTYAR